MRNFWGVLNQTPAGSIIHCFAWEIIKVHSQVRRIESNRWVGRTKKILVACGGDPVVTSNNLSSKPPFIPALTTQYFRGRLNLQKLYHLQDARHDIGTNRRPRGVPCFSPDTDHLACVPTKVRTSASGHVVDSWFPGGYVVITFLFQLTISFITQ